MPLVPTAYCPAGRRVFFVENRDRRLYWLLTSLFLTAAIGCIPLKPGAPANLRYAQPVIVATVGQAITADLPTVDNKVTAYTATSYLPPGLSLNASTGAIFGTPTAVKAQALYVIRASNVDGSATAGVQITVMSPAAAPSNLAYPQAIIAATVGRAITADVPSVTGTVTSFTVAPALPPGLGLSATTGSITGTPTAVAALTVYTITASNSGGSTTASVQISVVAPAIAPSHLVYAQPVIAATVGQAITVDDPTVTGTVTAYAISPGLPPGLGLNAATGAIVGTPTVATPLANYIVTASGPIGSTTTSVQIGVDATSTPPSNLVYPQPAIAAAVAQTIFTNVPNVSGTVTGYSVSPALPQGISLDPITGAISGTPTLVSSTASFVVTASNPSGSTTATITIAVTGALTALLDLGQIGQIQDIRVEATRVLSRDDTDHWLLQNYATGVTLASGNQGMGNPNGAYPVPVWMVALAGPTAVIGITNGLEVRSAADGHLQATLVGLGIDSDLRYPGPSWWRLASDGSYICGGSAQGLAVWAPDGTLLVSKQGDYSAANVFAAPAEIEVALGPAGVHVIESISVTDGTSTVGPVFSGNFNTWFVDGPKFLTNLANTVWTYSKAGVQQAMVTLPFVDNLTGQGNWIWIYQDSTPGYAFNIYAVGGNVSATTYSLDVLTKVVPSGLTIGVLSYGAGAASVIDLSGTTPLKTDYTVPLTYLNAYAATSSSQWIVGNFHGVLLDGSSAATLPRFLTQGRSYSAAGGAGRVAFTTATGNIDIFNPASASLDGTIAFPASKLALSTDGTLLAAYGIANIDSQYHPDQSLKIFTLPSAALLYNFPYTLSEINGARNLFDFSFSASGTTMSRLLATYNNQSFSYIQQVTPISGSPTIWTAATQSSRSTVLLSPDGTLIAVYDGSYNQLTTASIYKNGTFVATVAGAPIGWIDDDRLLTDLYSPPGRYTPSMYAGSEIYNSLGAQLATPALPPLSSFQTVAADLIYSSSYNQIFSLTTGKPTWTASQPRSGSAAWSPGYVAYQTGTRIVVEAAP